MSQNDSDISPNPDSPSNSGAAPDVMARILEPRVRSNAKNNPRSAKTSLPKAPAPEAPAQAPEKVVSPVPGEAIKGEILLETATKAASKPGAPAETPPEMAAPTLSELRDLMIALQESDQARERAFDLLYEELNGYKNDFYLERLKPTLRALLFLLDSIEEFEREVASFETRGEAVPTEITKVNLVHFRNQLTDVFTLSDLSPIESKGDKFDPKTQRAVEVVKVDAAQHNTVQRQIRGAWKIGEKMLRAADVVVGRS